MKAVFLGDSHAHAVIRSLARTPDLTWVSAVDVRRIQSPGHNPKEVPADLARRYPADIVFCCLGGTEYNLLSLIEADEPTDFMVDPGDTVMPGRKVIPNAVVRAALAFRMRSAHGRLQAVRAAYKSPLVCVAPPPPFFELGDPAGLPSAFAPFLSRGITPAQIRQKWYRTQMDLLAVQCAADGLRLMPAPSAVQDAQGFLLRDFWTNDPTHGNAAYGAALIEQIKAFELV